MELGHWPVDLEVDSGRIKGARRAGAAIYRQNRKLRAQKGGYLKRNGQPIGWCSEK